jgi:hypothetical protein
MPDIKLLIDEQTAEVTTAAFNIDNIYPLTVAASGLAGNETVDVQIEINGTYVDVYESGTQIQLTETGNIIQINPCGVYRLYKALTVGPVSVITADRTTAN